MFDRIAGRYDFLNHFLSGGVDVLWRKRMARELSVLPHEAILDLATGTGDQLIALKRACPQMKTGVGVDVSRGMLVRGHEKLIERQLSPGLQMVHGDAMALPLCSGTMDAATISFGIRNVPDVPKALREMLRVLKPGGHALILECGMPRNALIRKGYLLYFRHVLPRLGSLISGDGYAYHYLNKTVETFPCGPQFVELMQDAGFQKIRNIPMTFGVAYLYIGQKP